jgi:hypothetical protein
MNNKEKKYDNLDKSFEQEKNRINEKSKEIEEKSRRAMEILGNIYPNKKTSFKQKHIKISITLPENDSEFVRTLRSQIADPGTDFFPTRSDIFRAAVELLKKAKKEEVTRIIKTS